MELDRSELVNQLREKTSELGNFDAEEEIEHAIAVLAGDRERQMQEELGLTSYDEVRVEGAGGSGLVLSARFVPHDQRRALKIPRKGIYEGHVPSGQIEPVDPETEALAKLSHRNITRLFSAAALSGGKGWCLVTECVESPVSSLLKFALETCASQECIADAGLTTRALRHFSEVALQLVDALKYMHDEAALLHFDIKPDNLLVSAKGVPYVTDLGFARPFGSQGRQDVEVGFTAPYAHPRLIDWKHIKITSTYAKSKTVVAADELAPRFDIFALGRSLQEVLKALETEHGEGIASNYYFAFLHLVACLCLDGENAFIERRSRFHPDVALGLPPALFKEQKFDRMAQVHLALQRLLGHRRLEDDLPELDRWSRNTIKVSDYGVTTFTPRIKAIVDHPLFKRLAKERQLGMSDIAFPTATHNRYQHSLGVYHAVREYLSALYYDPENPTFRVLCDVDSCAAALVGSLLHDVGQSTFGHELEEVDKEFSHESAARQIIRANVKDSKGRTLAAIIEGSEPESWNIGTDLVMDLLEGRRLAKPFQWVLHDALNGQLDADKFDYLVRDSVESRVSYGRGIDAERFLRSLTTAPDEDGPALRLAVKQKGAAGAESFALARYQLYQSVYWHHTQRAAIGMFITAAAVTLTHLRNEFPQATTDSPLFDQFLIHVIGLRDVPVPSGLTRQRSSPKTLAEKIARLLADEAEPPGDTEYTTNATMRFLWRLSAEVPRARAILHDLLTRRLYKRLLEIPLSTFPGSGWSDLKSALSQERRSAFQERVEGVLGGALLSALQDASKTRESLVRDKSLERSAEILSSRFGFVVDLPLRGWSASGRAPLFVSDSRRRYFGVGGGSPTAGSLWGGQLDDMMRRIAVFRVYAEPTIHQLMTRVMDAKQVAQALGAEIQELKGLKVP